MVVGGEVINQFLGTGGPNLRHHISLAPYPCYSEPPAATLAWRGRVEESAFP